MKLIELLWADIFRDGGSYGAEFSTDENLNYSVFLERSRMNDKAGLHHRWLFEYRAEFSERPENGLPVITGSLEEQQLINRLESFLDVNPKSEIEGQYGSRNYHLRQLEELLRYISLREPCFPGDVKAHFSKCI